MRTTISHRASFHGRAIIVALLVGTVLNCINQGPDILYGARPELVKMGLTYLVPYLVSIYSAYAAARQFSKPR